MKLHSNKKANSFGSFTSANSMAYLHTHLGKTTAIQRNSGDLIYLFTKENNLQETEQELVTIGLHHRKGYFKVNDYVEYTIKGGDISITDQNDLKKSNIREKEFIKGYISNDVGVPHTRLPKYLFTSTKFRKKFAHCQSGARAISSSKLREHYDLIASNVKNQFTSKENAGHKMLTPNTR